MTTRDRVSRGRGLPAFRPEPNEAPMTMAIADEAETASQPADGRRAVRNWLLFLIWLVFLMVLVGGATRLTESGLSITEWNLVTGTIPPLSEAAWQSEFDLYRQSPQYALLNHGMSLADFKTIYWWEWGHRELGRFIGLVYIAGFLWFVGKSRLSIGAVVTLAALGVLLAAQGLVGWIMVASGLEPGMTAVAPVKLTLHLTLACLFFGALVMVYIRLGGAQSEAASLRSRLAAWLLVALTLVQIVLGGLVAGHDAGLVYNTWPLMDDRVVPRGLGAMEPLWLNFVDNVATIQFNHRIGAYLLVVAIIAYTAATWRSGGPVRHRALLLSFLVLAQTGIGVATLLTFVPISLGVLHQAAALILLFVLVWNATVLRRARDG